MTAYIVRRMLLVFPTLLGIMLINFVVIQAAPGGPVEQMIAQIKGTAVSATARVTGGGGQSEVGSAPASGQGGAASRYRGSRGLPPELIAEIEKQFGFDQPAPVRFWRMMKSYAVFDFGESFFRDRKVVDLILDKMPVSISLGIWTTLLVYLISIPLGVAKAVREIGRAHV